MNSSLKKIWWFIGLIALVNVFIVIFVIMGRDRGNDRPMDPRPQDIIAHELGLTPDQNKVYQEKIDFHMKSIKKLEEKRKNLKDKLFESLTKTPYEVDSESIHALSEVQEEIEYLHVGHLYELRLICDEEQLVKYFDIVQDFGKIFSPKHINQGDNRPPHGGMLQDRDILKHFNSIFALLFFVWDAP